MNPSILETSQILKRMVRETLLSNYSISEVESLILVVHGIGFQNIEQVNDTVPDISLRTA